MYRARLSSLCRPGALLLALLALPPASAGQFGVSPIRVDLDRESKSGAITVSNDEDAQSLRVQMRLFEWTQDAEGKDVYQESQDLVYFPRLMVLEKGQQKLVRVGLRTPATTQEKTYRLFVEELPAPPAPGAASGSHVAIAVRFGVPVYLKPAKEELHAEISRLVLSKGVLHVDVRNTGNTHFTIKSVTASSGKSFSREMAGWYLLAGATRDHAIELPAADCARLGKLDVIVATDQMELRGALDVDASMCER
jgi:fimbrial chaperone protein